MEIPPSAPTAAGSGLTDVNLPKKAAATNEPKGDTVEISPHARAVQLNQQGASNSVIAAQLGMDAKTVQSYFGTPTVAAATTPQPINSAHEAVQNIAVKVQAAAPAKK